MALVDVKTETVKAEAVGIQGRWEVAIASPHYSSPNMHADIPAGGYPEEGTGETWTEQQESDRAAQCPMHSND